MFYDHFFTNLLPVNNCINDVNAIFPTGGIYFGVFPFEFCLLFF